MIKAAESVESVRSVISTIITLSFNPGEALVFLAITEPVFGFLSRVGQSTLSANASPLPDTGSRSGEKRKIGVGIEPSWPIFAAKEGLWCPKRGYADFGVR